MTTVARQQCAALQVTTPVRTGRNDYVASSAGSLCSRIHALHKSDFKFLRLVLAAGNRKFASMFFFRSPSVEKPMTYSPRSACLPAEHDSW